MKEIKHYLHLYLGCEIYYPETKETTTVSWTHLLDLWSAESKGEKWKPPLFVFILRPLSDMTEEEKTYALKLGASYMDSWIGGANRTALLLSKHFDLFGLIEAGLAIDASKLEQLNK